MGLLAKQFCKGLHYAGFFIACMLPSLAYAGAWTQQKDAVQLINTIDYYHSDERYNAAGHKIDQPTYRAVGYSPYLEYGFDAKTTLGGSLLFQRASSLGNSNYGLSQAEIFVRRKIWENNSFVFSLEPKLKLPGIFHDNQPLLGSSQTDAAIAAKAGYGFSWFGRNHYVAVDAEYRERFGSPHNQYRASAEMGLNIAERVTIMPQVFLTWRTSDVQPTTFTQSARDDYDLTRVQLSGLYKLTDSHSLQVGAYRDVDGKNVGAATGGIIALWSQF